MANQHPHFLKIFLPTCLIAVCILIFQRNYDVSWLELSLNTSKLHPTKNTQTKAQRQQAELETWLQHQDNQKNAHAYTGYLRTQVIKQLEKQGNTSTEQAVYIPQLYELLHNSHAVKHASCNLPTFTVPPRKTWQQLVPTITLINQLKSQSTLPDIRVTSGYRDKKTNTCVGGSKASKHLSNAALDFTLINNTIEEQSKTDQELCQFWKKYGKKHRMGLGTYGKGRYHIDTNGYRTWGKDYKRQTSVCHSER